MINLILFANPKSKINFIKNHIEQVSLLKNNIRYWHCSCLDSVAEKILSLEIVDIIIICINEKNGKCYQLLNHLSEKYPKQKILIITRSRVVLNYCFSIGVNAVLLEPIETYDLIKALIKLICRDSPKNKILIKSKKTIVVNRENVIFLESLNRKVIINGLNERYILHCCLSDVYDIFSDINIIRCHQSFMVNLNYVKKYSTKELEVLSGYKIPIGRSFSKSLAEYLDIYFDCITSSAAGGNFSNN